MKLSKGTLDILKNFSNINPSITFKEGQELSTLSIQKNILSRAVVEETFPRNFAIYDLQQFLSGVSLFENPELDFDNPNYVIIKMTTMSLSKIENVNQDISLLTHQLLQHHQRTEQRFLVRMFVSLFHGMI